MNPSFKPLPQLTSDAEQSGTGVKSAVLERPMPDAPPPVKHNWSKKLLKPILWGGAGLLVAGFLVNAFKPIPVSVETATIERGDLQVSVNAEGKTRIEDRFVVAAPVNGRLQRVQLEVGDMVAAGDVIARLDPIAIETAIRQTLSELQEWQAQRAGVNTQRPKTEALAQARARVQTAQANQAKVEAQVAQAQAGLNQAIRDRQRDRDLAAAGAISQKSLESSELATVTRQKELDTVRMAAAAARSEVEVAGAALKVLQQERSDPDYLLQVYDAKIASAEAELARLRDDARQTVVRAPAAGRVLEINRKSAQFLTEGTPILTLGNVKDLELVIDVLSSDAAKIQPGDAILVEQGRDRVPLKAQVKRIEPAAFTKVSALGVEEQRVNVIGEFKVLPQNLGDAYRLDTRIVIWQGNDRVKVPLSALFRCQSDWCVFTQAGDQAKRQTVQIGQRDRLMAEVTEGLDPGQIVILHPTDKVGDGVLVQAKSSR